MQMSASKRLSNNRIFQRIASSSQSVIQYSGPVLCYSCIGGKGVMDSPRVICNFGIILKCGKSITRDPAITIAIVQLLKNLQILSIFLPAGE
jgi:hypothetical protein